MSKRIMKRLLALLVALSMLCGLAAGCGGGKKPAGDTVSAGSAGTATEAAKVEKTKVDFWYLWGDPEKKFVEEFIEKYNSQQDKYEVKGLYVADMQKVKVAIAGGTGPDITDDFGNNIATYADQGIIEPLDEYIKRDSIDFSDYIKGAIESCQYKGKTYAIPCGVTFFSLYYNKTLLEKAGYTEPPKTFSEMLEMSIKTTELAADKKTIDVLGFPDFPYVYYLRNFMYAGGGKLFTEDGGFTPNTPEMLASLKLMVDYRKQFGYENVVKFNQAGKYVQATDPFMTGNQVFRIDGPWLANIIRNDLKIGQDKLDFGITSLPYPDGKPELAGSGELTSIIFKIIGGGKRMKKTRRDFISGILFTSPWIIGFLIFTLYPIVISFYYSFTNFSIFKSPEFVGFNTYKDVFSDSLFHKGFLNTAWMTLIATPVNIIFALGIAMLLNIKAKGMSVYRTIFYVPTIVPQVASTILWVWILNARYGLVNNVLGHLGLYKPNWFNDPAYTKPSLIIIGIWVTGSMMIIFLASLQDVPVSLYESAEIDGANNWNKFIKITLPSISPVILYQVIMSVIANLQIFTPAWIIGESTGIMNNGIFGGPENSLLFYASYLFYSAFTYFRMGHASAMAWILFIIAAIVTWIIFRVSKNSVTYGGE